MSIYVLLFLVLVLIMLLAPFILMHMGYLAAVFSNPGKRFETTKMERGETL
jgi:hypothetical protein